MAIIDDLTTYQHRLRHNLNDKDQSHLDCGDLKAALKVAYTVL